jgi:hypothetical protein
VTAKVVKLPLGLVCYEGESGMDKRLVGAIVASAAAILAVSACSSGSISSFVPGGGASIGAVATAVASTPAPGGIVMPPFGKKTHVLMTGWQPASTSMAAAVRVDKDYELAYLYAEYTGGQADGWMTYVSSTMRSEVSNVLSQQNVTTESFTGTIRIFDMKVIQDPVVTGDVDVSACFDNAQSSNTNLQTGAVLADTSPADSHYYQYTDQLARTSSGQWQVVSDYPLVYYPRAKECKP